MLGFAINAIIATAMFALGMFFVSLAGTLRLLPSIVPLIARALWGLLILSCRFYFLLLSRVAPFIQQHLRVNILDGLWRLAVTEFMSLTLGFAFMWLLHWSLAEWSLVLLILHGLFVDLIWDEIPEAGNLLMGVKL